MKRRLSRVLDDDLSIHASSSSSSSSSGNKYSKLSKLISENSSSSGTSGTVILHDFQPRRFDDGSSTLWNLLNGYHGLLKTKFEDQCKGFCKWLKAKEEWIKQIEQRRPDDEWENMKIEFMNDRECVEAYLCAENKQLSETVAFWRPYKREILRHIKASRLQVLKFIPKEMLFEWKEELSGIFQKNYGFSFIFDLDDFDESKTALSEKRCLFKQLSERLRDNEEIEFILQILNTPISMMDGKIKEEMIETFTPEVYDLIPKNIRDELPMDVKMHVYQQLFLKDLYHDCLSYDLCLPKEVFKMLSDLPDEYYQAHKRYQRKLKEKGKFMNSILEVYLEKPDGEFNRIVEKVIPRIYMDFENNLDNDEDFLKRLDLPLVMFSKQASKLWGRNDKEFILTALKSRYPCSFHEIPRTFQNDRDCMMAVIDNHFHHGELLQTFFTNLC
nr:unnamed protein product [Naegleria fowleri]